jgi:hypothetical protein
MRSPYKVIRKMFPELFRELMMPSLMPGWVDIFCSLCEKIDEAATRYGVPRDSPDYPAILYFKEKYGVLTVMVKSENTALLDVILNLTDAAQEASSKICCGCGAPVTAMREDRWIRNFCDSCELAYQQRFD